MHLPSLPLLYALLLIRPKWGSVPALKHACSSFVTGPKGNERDELDVLSNYGKDKKPV